MQKLTKAAPHPGTTTTKAPKKEGSVGVVTAGAPPTGAGGQSAIAANAAVANICFAQMLS